MRPAPKLRSSLVLLGLLVTASGCEPTGDARLLQVDGVEPPRVEPGTRLRVTGAGFPAGREGRLVLRGILRRPGAEPVAVDAARSIRALSGEILEGTVSGAWVEQVGGRGTFEGDLWVEFAGVDEGARVVGRLPAVSLDFAPDGATRLGTELGRRRRGDALIARLGIRPAQDAAADEGITVDGIDSEGPAALSGITKGDRIVAVDGVRVSDLADLAPRPRAASTILTVVRAGEAGTLRLRVPLEVEERGPSAHAWTVGAAVAAACLWLLFFVAPSARLTSRLVRALSRPRARTARPSPSAEDPLWRRARDGARRWAWLAVGALASVLALGVLPFTAKLYPGGIDAGVLLFSAFAARLVIGAGATARPSGSAAVRRVATLRRIGGFLLDGVPAAASVGAIVLLSGTVRLGGIVDAQGGLPWEWYLFRNPVAFVLFPVFVVATLVPEQGERLRSRSVPAQVALRTQRFAMAGLGTALFLGGWNLPAVSGDPLAGEPAWRLVAAGSFVLKAWLLSAAAGRFEASARRGRWTVPVALVCMTIAGTALLAPWPPMLERVSGPLLAGLAAAMLLYGLSRRRQIGRDDVVAQPFL